jgi:hypothetical protein
LGIGQQSPANVFRVNHLPPACQFHTGLSLLRLIHLPCDASAKQFGRDRIGHIKHLPGRHGSVYAGELAIGDEFHVSYLRGRAELMYGPRDGTALSRTDSNENVTRSFLNPFWTPSCVAKPKAEPHYFKRRWALSDNAVSQSKFRIADNPELDELRATDPYRRRRVEFPLAPRLRSRVPDLKRGSR